jgi:NADPH2:quinone reductase
VDVILDMVGGDYMQPNIGALGFEGRLVMIAFLGGPKANVNFTQMMMRRQTITGSTLRPQSHAVKAGIAQELRDKVWPLLNSGKIEPVIHETFALKDAAKAHALMESSAHIGKIVLNVADATG